GESCSGRLWSGVEPTTAASGPESRQVLEAEPTEGVWSVWGEWSECSQTCGVGVSQRSRRCLPPPAPVVSPVNPYYPHRYPGQHRPYHASPLPSNRNPGLPLYRNTPAGEAGPPVPGQANRSSSIRPGQFGYGRVPFSLPLHRPNRQARHTANSTDDPLNEDSTGPAPPGPAATQRAEPGQRTTSPPVSPLLPLLPHCGPPAPVRLALRHRSSSPRPSPVSARLTLLASPPPARAWTQTQSQGAPPGRQCLPPAASSPVAPGSGARQGGGRSLAGLQVFRTREGASQVFLTGRSPDRFTWNVSVLTLSCRCLQVCAGGSLDSRAEQCAAFNSQEFMGRLYNWEPFTEGEQQCELTCRPAGYRFYVRQAERVRDGTTCFNVSTNDVCVDGRCLTEGCDGVLGSGSLVDRCGVCGGRETSCRKVTGSFQNATVPLGYHKILDIPPGATFINITERRASPNYLAMRSGTGASVVNGRWAVDPPGEYQAGGTTFTYTRPRAQAEGEEERGESLKAPGPTSPLTVSMEEAAPVAPPALAPSFPSSSSSSSSSDRWTPDRSRPRGSAPNRNARIPPRTDLPPDTQPPFVWRRGGLSECSASCGKGSQVRVLLCIDRHTDEEVPERKCDSAARPAPEEESCNNQPCPPFWEVSSWSECSVSCGAGVQQRQLQCRQSFGNRSTMVHPQRCAALSAPESTQACQLRLCSHWEVGSDWSSCSVDCGVGRRTRSVRCISDQGSVVNDQECNSRLRPQGDEECNMGPCVTNWYFTGWSNTCSAQCGPGVQKREVVCLTRGGVREGGGGGDCVGDKPAEMKACNGGPCVPTTLWYSSAWTQCNVPCGEGTQRRDIICVQKLGNDFTVVPAAECAHLDKPAAVQECEMGECRPQWFTTEWSACSRSCGQGLQMREVRCLTAEKKHSPECDPDTKPEQDQTCNTIPCSPQVADENCRDRRHNCVMVVQARLCVYSYYKAACCASCTQSLFPPDPSGTTL
uniref:ADAMTS like 4 n=1 Tax=Stegastes partitus TaxID=144197 RepID=A0A3B5B4U7_9TELE